MSAMAQWGVDVLVRRLFRAGVPYASSLHCMAWREAAKVW